MTKNKLGAVKLTVDGIEFDSKFEGQTYEALLVLEQEGLVRNIERQVPIILIPKFSFGATSQRECKIIVDFKLEAFIENKWVEIYFETKGYQTEVSRIKVKLLKFLRKDMRGAGLFTYILFHGRVQKNLDIQVEAVRKALYTSIMGTKRYKEVFGGE